jgi:aryl-alcohol dehydrogenase-like predicted oxidoreductase
MQRLMNEEVLSAVDGLRPLASEAGLSMTQLALAWVLRQENVSSAIIGASRPEQVEDNARAAGVTLFPEVASRIDEVLEGVIQSG